MLFHILSIYILSLIVSSVSGQCTQPLENPTVCCINTAPATFDVLFTTTRGEFTFHIERIWAPLGVDRFYQMITCGSGYLSNGTGYSAGNAAGFFRYVPDFVVQFGISGIPAISAAWNNEIQDDPVVLSNLPGTIAFATAGPNTRTTQLFINFANNSFLDSQGFAPFGNVTTDAGFKVIESIYSAYGQDPDQNSIYTLGDAYLIQNFPLLDYILNTTIVS